MVMEKKRIKSEIEVYIQGSSLIISEYYSHGYLEKVLKKAIEENGLIFTKKCRSLCG
jgi:hypothetical protein